jgi:hypothetical protein
MVNMMLVMPLVSRREAPREPADHSTQINMGFSTLKICTVLAGCLAKLTPSLASSNKYNKTLSNHLKTTVKTTVKPTASN